MKNKSSNNKHIKQVFIFMKPYALSYVFGLIMYSSQTFILSYSMSLLLKWLSSSLLNQSVSEVFTSVIRFGIILLVWMILLAFGVYAYVMCATKAAKDMKMRLYRNFIRNSIEKNAGHNSSEGIAAINTEADSASNIYDNSTSALLGSCISILFSAVIIFSIDWRLGIISLGIGLISFLPQYRFAKPLAVIGEGSLKLNASALKHVSQLFSGAASIRAYGLEKKQEEEFGRINHQMYLLSLKESFISMGQDIFTTLQGFLSLAGIFGIGGYLAAIGKLEFAALMMVPSLCGSMSMGMSNIGAAYASMQKSIAACKKLAPMLENHKIDEEEAYKADECTVALEDSDINIKGLDFTYLSSSVPVLSDISLKIPHNQMTAFVGESGSGKSTLLKLIMGMYEREELPITLGNMPISKCSKTAWRRNFAYVDQSCKLFDMTIAENIRLGMPGSSDEEVEKAAIAAGADEFIKKLPSGYDSGCGEEGAFISGGQKQRIAIARALIRKSPVLVFDEAASALDHDSKELVMSSIRQLKGKHTILITTHNLKEIQDAGLIVVMKDGRAAEYGTHDELLKNNGEYVKLLNIQQ